MTTRTKPTMRRALLLGAALLLAACTPEEQRTDTGAESLTPAGPADTTGMSGSATDTLGTSAGAPPGGQGSAASGSPSDSSGASRAGTGDSTALQP